MNANSKNITALLVFAIISAFISQTLVDLADVILVVTALFVAHKRQELKVLSQGFKPNYFWLTWIFIVVAGLINNLGVLNLETWLAVSEFKWIITLLSIIYLTKTLADSSQLREKLLKPILIMNLISLILNFRPGEGRVAGVLNAVMAFSQNIAPIFCLFTILCFSHWKYFSRNEKVMVSLIAVSAGILTLLTLTRGVWIGSAAGILIGLLIWNFKRGLQISGIFFLFVAILFASSTRIQQRVLSKTYDETSSNDVRLALWKANLRIVQDHPILGVGHGQNKFHLRKYYDEMGYPGDMLISHAHNQYLQVWAGTGTLGLACYLFFLFLIFKTVSKAYRNALPDQQGFLLGLISALICFVISSLTEANFNISKNRFLFLLLAGIAIGLSHINASQAKEST